jgi:hypothetical protein
VVKSVTVPGKCYTISDGDRQDDPISIHQFVRKLYKFVIYKFVTYNFVYNNL